MNRSKDRATSQNIQNMDTSEHSQRRSFLVPCHTFHPGQHTMIDTMSRHAFWRGMNKDIIKFVQTCPACQKRKSHRKTFAKLPLNLQASKPWQVLSVDLVVPYKITDADKKKYELNALTMADPATGWFEIIELV